MRDFHSKLVITVSAILMVITGCASHESLAQKYGTPGHQPRIFSGFGSLYGAEGYLRPEGPHSGIDFAGHVGNPVLAIADGSVKSATDHPWDCGPNVVISNWSRYESTYCHLSHYSVKPGSSVKRGDVIGYIGRTGKKPGVGYEHVHLMVWDESAKRRIDPMQLIVGCFNHSIPPPWYLAVYSFPVQC